MRGCWLPTRSMQPTPWTPPPAIYYHLQQRLAYRQDLVKMRTQERNHLHALCHHPHADAAIIQRQRQHLAYLSGQIEALKTEVKTLLAGDHPWRKARRLQTIKGLARSSPPGSWSPQCSPFATRRNNCCLRWPGTLSAPLWLLPAATRSASRTDPVTPNCAPCSIWPPYPPLATPRRSKLSMTAYSRGKPNKVARVAARAQTRPHCVGRRGEGARL